MWEVCVRINSMIKAVHKKLVSSYSTKLGMGNKAGNNSKKFTRHITVYLDESPCWNRLAALVFRLNMFPVCLDCKVVNDGIK